MDAHDDPEGRVGPLQLLAQEPEADVVHAAAAVPLGDRARRGNPAAPILRKVGRWTSWRSSQLADVGQDLRLREGARGVPDEDVLRGQLEVDQGASLLRRDRHDAGVVRVGLGGGTGHDSRVGGRRRLTSFITHRLPADPSPAPNAWALGGRHALGLVVRRAASGPLAADRSP